MDKLKFDELEELKDQSHEKQLAEGQKREEEDKSSFDDEIRKRKV